MNEQFPQQNIWELQGYLLNRQLRRAQAVKNMLKNSRLRLILDIGCAEGFFTSFLADEQTTVVGIDLDESIKIAKTKVKNAEFIRASITHLPFKDKCFEAVTLLEILEHLPAPILRDGIKEVDRMLNTGGILIISVPYKEKIIYTRCIHCGNPTPLWGHLHSLDENNISLILPKNYRLIKKKHLPNLGLILCSKFFELLPFRVWLLMNDLLGKLSKGYWMLLKYYKF